MTEIILNVLFILALPFLIPGVINKVKAAWAGRKGQSVFQPFFDFLRLMKKNTVISTTASFIFRAAPSVVLASALFAALLAPMTGHRSILSFDGDFVLFAYVLGLGRFFMIIAAMDTGSSFEGMGASREATFSVLAEPSFFILMGSLALLSGNTSFSKITAAVQWNPGVSVLVPALSIITLFLMILIEGCRVPVDDPNTHLELTMVHEVMVLDNSGPDLAYYSFGAWLKMAVLGGVIANLCIPAGAALWLNAVLYPVIVLLIAAAVGTVESLIARLKMSHVPQFIFIMTSLALIILSATLFFNPGGAR